MSRKIYLPVLGIWEDIDDVTLLQDVPRVSSDGALINPATGGAVLIPPAVPEIAFVGDSITMFGSRYQYQFAASAIVGVLPIGSNDFSLGAGTSKLKYDAANRTLSFAAPGEAYGTPQPAVAGFMQLPSATSTKRLLVGVKLDDLLTYGSVENTSLAVTDSKIAGVGCTYIGWVARFLGQGVAIQNWGIGGDTTSQIIARWNQIASGLGSATHVHIQTGTNDVTAGDSAEAIEENIAALVQLASATGRIVSVGAIPPNSSWSSGLQAIALAVNDWLVGYCATQRIIYVDCFTPMVSRTSLDPDSRVVADGTHESTRGGIVHARAFNAAVFPTLPVRSSRWVSSGQTENKLTNGIMAGTAGTAGTGASGSVADSWTVARTSGSTVTVVASKISRAASYLPDLQQLVIDNSGGAAGDQVCVDQTITLASLGWAVGDEVEFEAALAITAVGGSGFRNCGWVMQALSGASTVVLWAVDGYSYDGAPSTTQEETEIREQAVYRCRFVIPTGCDRLRARQINTMLATGTGTVTIGMAGWRKLA